MAQADKTELECRLKDAAETIRVLGSTSGQLERQGYKLKCEMETAVAERERGGYGGGGEQMGGDADRETAELKRLFDQREESIR